MERKIPFEEGETYHLYTRGVDKRTIFASEQDSERFLALLSLCNSKESVRIKPGRGEPSAKAFGAENASERIVGIFAYALMPNHIHLIVREKKTGGISKFMLKLMTAYSMYFNTKYERSGPLFTRPFRSKHIDTDEYFQWVFAYVHLNPLGLFQSDWKEKGLSDKDGGVEFMRAYRYGSYQDYFRGTRPESRILERGALPMSANDLGSMDDLLAALANDAYDYQKKRLLASQSVAALV